MKRTVSMLLVVVLVLMLCGCAREKAVSLPTPTPLPLVTPEPMYKEEHHREATYGDVFLLGVIVGHDGKSVEVLIQDKDKTAYDKRKYKKIDEAYLAEYDIENDFLNGNFSKIIGAYDGDKIRIYQYNWGILYSYDLKRWYTVYKHEYDEKYAFGEVYDLLIKDEAVTR